MDSNKPKRRRIGEKEPLDSPFSVRENPTLEELAGVVGDRTPVTVEAEGPLSISAETGRIAT